MNRKARKIDLSCPPCKGFIPKEDAIAVETLDLLHNPEARGVLNLAFEGHPLLPAGISDGTRAALLELVIRTFGGTKRAWLHGIRQDGVLACAAFSFDARCEPGAVATVRFFFRSWHLVGWRTAREFMEALSKRPRCDDRYLELMLLGTLPPFHGQGLGRAMLCFLYDFAGTGGFRGVILDTVRDTPPYRLYLKEGFVVDSEIMMNGVPLCNMRRDQGGMRASHI